MEENEEEFFSLWCNSESRKDALVLWNRSFRGDPIFNHATRVVCNKKEARSLVKQISNRLRAEGVPPCFYVSPLTRPVEFGDLLVSDGFHLLDQMRIMRFRGGAGNADKGITVEKVNESSVSAWAKIYMESFDIPPDWRDEVLKRYSIIVSDPHVALYSAIYRGQEVGCLALYSKGGVGGVYCVGTVPRWRRRGVASALIGRAVADSELLGNEILCLQTFDRDRLEDFYVLNGFRTVFARSIYLQD